MGNYKLNQSGSQIQSILDKADKLPVVSSEDSGKYVKVDSSGNFSAETGDSSGSSINMDIVTLSDWTSLSSPIGDYHYEVYIESPRYLYQNTNVRIYNVYNSLSFYTDGIIPANISKGSESSPGSITLYAKSNPGSIQIGIETYEVITPAISGYLNYASMTRFENDPITGNYILKLGEIGKEVTYTYGSDAQQIINAETKTVIAQGTTFTIGNINYSLSENDYYLLLQSSEGSIPVPPSVNKNRFEIGGHTYILHDNEYPRKLIDSDNSITIIEQDGLFVIDGNSYNIMTGLITGDNGGNNSFYPIIWGSEEASFTIDSTTYLYQTGFSLTDGSNNTIVFVSNSGYSGYSGHINGKLYYIEFNKDEWGNISSGDPYCLREDFYTYNWSEVESNNIASINSGILSINESNLNTNTYYSIEVPVTVTTITADNFIQTHIQEFHFNYNITNIGSNAFGGQILYAEVNYQSYPRTVIYPTSKPQPGTVPGINYAKKYNFVKSSNNYTAAVDVEGNNTNFTYTRVRRVANGSNILIDDIDQNNQFKLDNVTYIYVEEGEQGPHITDQNKTNTYPISSDPLGGKFTIDNENYYYIQIGDAVQVQGDKTYYTEYGYFTIESNPNINYSLMFLDKSYQYDVNTIINEPYCVREFIPENVDKDGFKWYSWESLSGDSAVSISNDTLTINNSNLPVNMGGESSSDYYYRLIIPNTVTVISDGNFSNCNVQELLFMADIPSQSIGSDPFTGVNSQVQRVVVGYENNHTEIYPEHTLMHFQLDESQQVELAEHWNLSVYPERNIVGGGGSMSEINVSVKTVNTTYTYKAINSANLEKYGKEVIGTFNPTTDATTITIIFPPKAQSK